MRMTVRSYQNMNELLQKCFNANAVIDNLAYCLDYHYYNEIAEVVHQKVAHVMPMWADMVSDKMLELSGRPVRKIIGGYEEDYQDLLKIFNVLNDVLVDIRGFARDMIESADMDGDDEVRIFCEDFIVLVSPFIKQAEEWINVATNSSAFDLNTHIHKYTHFIEL